MLLGLLIAGINVRSALPAEGCGDCFGVITAHDQLVELSALEVHPDTARGVVMYDGKDLRLARGEGADGHRPGNACAHTQPVDRAHGVVEHLDCSDGSERDLDLSVNGFHLFHRSQTHHQLVSVNDELGHVVLLRQRVLPETNQYPIRPQRMEIGSFWPGCSKVLRRPPVGQLMCEYL